MLLKILKCVCTYLWVGCQQHWEDVYHSDQKRVQNHHLPEKYPGKRQGVTGEKQSKMLKDMMEKRQLDNPLCTSLIVLQFFCWAMCNLVLYLRTEGRGRGCRTWHRGPCQRNPQLLANSIFLRQHIGTAAEETEMLLTTWSNAWSND